MREGHQAPPRPRRRTCQPIASQARSAARRAPAAIERESASSSARAMFDMVIGLAAAIDDRIRSGASLAVMNWASWIRVRTSGNLERCSSGRRCFRRCCASMPLSCRERAQPGSLVTPFQDRGETTAPACAIHPQRTGPRHYAAQGVPPRPRRKAHAKISVQHLGGRRNLDLQFLGAKDRSRNSSRSCSWRSARSAPKPPTRLRAHQHTTFPTVAQQAAQQQRLPAARWCNSLISRVPTAPPSTARASSRSAPG